MSIFKDCLEIWRILFDHYPFVQNQLNNFVKEFEGKRSDREVDNILDTLNILCEIKDVQCDRLKSVDTNCIQNLSFSIEEGIQVAQAILKQSERYPSVSKLEAQKFKELEWESFKQDIDNKYAEANSQFELETERLKKHYKNLRSSMKK